MVRAKREKAEWTDASAPPFPPAIAIWEPPFEKCENCFYAGQNLSDLFMKCDLQFPPWVQNKGLPAVHKQSKCSFFTHRD